MENKEKKSVITRIIDDIKESTKTQHEIDKADFAAVKADGKARFAEASAPNPDFVEFKSAKGIKKKTEVVVEHLIKNANEIRTKSQQNYEEMLRKQRDSSNLNLRLDI